jgi:hypothetical protein
MDFLLPLNLRPVLLLGSLPNFAAPEAEDQPPFELRGGPHA